MKNIKNIIKVAKYLSTVKEADTREIECGCGLTQPEVSTAIADLYDMRFVVKIRVPRGRGRPRIVAKLTKNIEEIENYIKNSLYIESLKEEK